MTVQSANRANRDVQGVVGSLALSLIRPGSSTLALRALRWHEQVQGLGLHLPFFLIHDVGMLLATDRGTFSVGERAPMRALRAQGLNSSELLSAYNQFIHDLSGCQVAKHAAALHLSDEVLAIVLGKLLFSIGRRMKTRPSYASQLPSDASLFEVEGQQLLQMFGAVARQYEWEALGLLQQHTMFVLTMADTLDLDTLRLLGVLGTDAAVGGGHVDMISALESPAAHDVVNFSLDILPSVLETKSKTGATSRVGFGVSGLGRQGELDRLVLSELAWDAEDFARRVLDGEVLYYMKESEPEPAGKRCLLLVDASASMRGQREVFARGMALATAKKLLLQGADVDFRFFDSRLYPQQRASNKYMPTAHILSFRGERGRNPRRVFMELIEALDIECARDNRSMLIHVFTHAALYIPRDLIEKIKKYATLAVVFMLPSGGKLDLDYLDLLDSHWVVDNAVLQKRAGRVKAAQAILGDVGESQQAHGGEGHG